jgi:hypothetical protein
MLATFLHALPIDTLDRYAQFIYGNLQLRTNRPGTLRHLENLLQYETDYLLALDQFMRKGSHFAALAELTDEELDELDPRAEHAHQTALVVELQTWQTALLAVIIGEAADESLNELEYRVEACYYVR